MGTEDFICRSETLFTYSNVLCRYAIQNRLNMRVLKITINDERIRRSWCRRKRKFLTAHAKCSVEDSQAAYSKPQEEPNHQRSYLKQCSRADGQSLENDVNEVVAALKQNLPQPMRTLNWSYS